MAARKAGLAAVALLGGLGFGQPGWAAQPEPWQFGFQEAATPIMERVTSFHDLLLVIITLISLFVLALLGYIIFRFNARSNPTPSRTAHSTLLEVVWTVIPIIILIAIAIPSFKLLYYSDRAVDAEMTLKAIGHQWYWSYEYPDHDGLTFDAIMKEEADLAADEPRLLATDNRVVVPVGTTIRVLVTADDVIHAWSVPAFGVKVDAVPGKVNEIWIHVDREGVYYGQCSELCGVNHAFMPIAVEAVSKARFAAWIEEAKLAFGSRGTPRHTAHLAGVVE
ncbi:MAG: cytochrome c oxidase subunit II [Alphaproteobacteria bacterium]|nr:cytochrome c oxidase subunit II [Alphaproteobacteria bacterium]